MINVLVADDHAKVRESLKRILGDCPDVEIAGEVASGDDLLPAVRGGLVDVILLDINMPGPRFLDLLRQLESRPPVPRVLVLSAHTEDQFALAALKAGAAGYVTKNRATEELCRAIQAIAGGRRYLSNHELGERLEQESGD